MDVSPPEPIAPLRRPGVRILLTTTVGCDLVVSTLAYLHWQSYLAAPKNAFLAPEDDAGFFVSGLGYGLASLVRYVVMVVLVLTVFHFQVVARRQGSGGTSTARKVVVVLAALDVAYLAATWSGPHPSATSVSLRVATCLANALVAGGVLLPGRRGARRRS